MKLQTLIIMLLLCGVGYAADINKTLYYNVTSDYNITIYDKSNFSITIDLVNDSSERSFKVPFNYSITNITTSLNTSTVQIAVACGDTSLTCPTITIPPCPTDPAIPACPAAPSCPPIPACDNSALNNCLASVDKKLNPTTTEQDKWITYGLIAAIVIVVGLLLVKQFQKPKPPIIVKKAITPEPVVPQRRQAPPQKQIPQRPEQKYKPQMAPSEDPRKTIIRAHVENAKRLTEEMEAEQEPQPEEPNVDLTEEEINEQLRDYISRRK